MSAIGGKHGLGNAAAGPGPCRRAALCLLLLLGLASCATAPGPVAFRAADAPIYSNASFDPSRLLGSWQQVATFGTNGAGCPAGQVTFSRATDDAIVAEARLCLAGRVSDWKGQARQVGPGRFVIGGSEALWVLWDDADNRTLVIGTPSGRFGFILDRQGVLPADRLAAAREILDFNGYDLNRLFAYR